MAVGTIANIHAWLESLISQGPVYGYYVKKAKTWLIVKKEVELEVRNLFQGLGINITTAGRPYLGAPLGTEAFIEDFVCSMVELWSSIIETLTETASSSPHAAYTIFTPLEDLIRTRFFPHPDWTGIPK